MLTQQCSLAKFRGYTVLTKDYSIFSLTSVPPLFCGACTNAMPLTTAGLAQSVEHLTTEREVMVLIPGTRPILRVLKMTEK